MRGFKLLTTAAAGMLVAGGALAQSPADFYKGRTVTILHGFGVGGTYGKTSLSLARELKSILGADSVIVQNRPGSGGLKMTNYAYNVAPKDGSVLLMLPDTLVVTQLTRPKAAKYEADKFTFLGGALKVNSVLVVRSDTGVKKWSDLKTKEVPLASSGVGSQTYQVPAIVNGLLGTKMKIVKGYRGSRKMLLAMEQGEVAGINLTWLAFKTNRQVWFENGFAVPVIQMGPAPEAELANVPMLKDLVAAEDRPIIGFMSTLVAIAQPRDPAGRIAGKDRVPAGGVREDRRPALLRGFDEEEQAQGYSQHGRGDPESREREPQDQAGGRRQGARASVRQAVTKNRLLNGRPGPAKPGRFVCAAAGV